MKAQKKGKKVIQEKTEKTKKKGSRLLKEREKNQKTRLPFRDISLAQKQSTMGGPGGDGKKTPGDLTSLTYFILQRKI